MLKIHSRTSRSKYLNQNEKFKPSYMDLKQIQIQPNIGKAWPHEYRICKILDFLEYFNLSMLWVRSLDKKGHSAKILND